MTKQLIKIAILLGRIKIIIDKSWSLPFSLYMYQTKSRYFNIETFYKMLEISLFNLCIIFCIYEEEDGK